MFLNSTSTPHWVVNGEKFSHQFTAWKYALAQNTVPEFKFYEDEYATVDWTVDPTRTWQELCADRCTQLRQKYQHLSLFYSAGRDSHHILRSFVKENIPLDELIVIEYRNNPVRMFELKNYILPQVKKYQAINPKVKVTTLVIGKKEFELMYTDDWLEKAPGLHAGFFQPIAFDFKMSLLGRYNLHTHGVIIGIDKPRILIEHGKLYGTVLDKTAENFISWTPNLELFYFAPDMPEMHVKQTRMCAQHLLAHYRDRLTPEFLVDYCGNSHSVYYDDFCMSAGRGPAWDVTLGIQNGTSKHRNQGRSELFQNMIAQGQKEKWSAAINFKESFEQIAEPMTSAFNKGDPYLGTIGVYGKKYYLMDV